ALVAGVRAVFGDLALIQCCELHKRLWLSTSPRPNATRSTSACAARSPTRTPRPGCGRSRPRGHTGGFFEVRSPDGTIYRFGYGRNESTSEDQESLWSLPVVGSHPAAPGSCGAPCCTQGWRWSLDKVTDSN